MKNKIPDFNKYLNKASSTHHYIPKFLIKGFTNSDGLLYIYDKEKDEIQKKPRPPKSIFFEEDRNTIELDSNTKSSVIEDFYYKYIDDKTCKVIKQYQTQELSKIDFKTEDTALLYFFLITLFWRIPMTDYAAENLIARSTIIANGIDPEILRNDPTFKKLNRAGLFGHHIEEMAKFGIKGKKWLNIHQNQYPIYVVGDYPFLFKKEPETLGEFDDTDILFALNSNRIYSSTNEILNNFPLTNSFGYNAAIINQSVKYIACSDLKILKLSVDHYKMIKEKGLFYSTETINELVFKTN